jgi:hypothetical protein
MACYRCFVKGCENDFERGCYGYIFDMWSVMKFDRGLLMNWNVMLLSMFEMWPVRGGLIEAFLIILNILLWSIFEMQPVRGGLCIYDYDFEAWYSVLYLLCGLL